jgi:hypothetical protein
MKPEDIIGMAREAGFAASWSEAAGEALKRLVSIAQAEERNKLAAWMIAQGYATGHGDTIEGLLEELRWQVRESERYARLSCIKPNATSISMPPPSE